MTAPKKLRVQSAELRVERLGRAGGGTACRASSGAEPVLEKRQGESFGLCRCSRSQSVSPPDKPRL